MPRPAARALGGHRLVRPAALDDGHEPGEAALFVDEECARLADDVAIVGDVERAHLARDHAVERAQYVLKLVRGRAARAVLHEHAARDREEGVPGVVLVGALREREERAERSRIGIERHADDARERHQISIVGAELHRVTERADQVPKGRRVPDGIDQVQAGPVQRGARGRIGLELAGQIAERADRWSVEHAGEIRGERALRPVREVTRSGVRRDAATYEVDEDRRQRR